jgi:transposase
VRQAHIPFVPKKSVEQQDIQALHRARQRMVNHRTALVSQMRGLLLDRGFALAKSITCARRLIPQILANFDNELTAMARDAISELFDLFRDLDRRIAMFDKKTERVFLDREPCQRIAKNQGHWPEDRNGNRRRNRRWFGVQERTAPGCLGGSRSTAVLQW